MIGAVPQTFSHEILEQLKNARLLAKTMIGKIEKGLKAGTERRVFVATIQERHGLKTVTIPIGYIAYWISPSGMKYNADRIFVRQHYRERGYGVRIAMRSLGRAFLRHPELSVAVYMDARPPYPTIHLVEELKGRGFINRYEQEGRNYELYLKKEALQAEASLITAFEKLKKTPKWKRILTKKGRLTARELRKKREEYKRAWGERTRKQRRMR